MGAVYNSFTATANSATVEGTVTEVIIGGTFTATVVLECAIPGAAGADLWVAVGTALTAPGTIQYNGMTTRKWRARCSAYTSGAVYFQLVASRDRGLLET